MFMAAFMVSPRTILQLGLPNFFSSLGPACQPTQSAHTRKQLQVFGGHREALHPCERCAASKLLLFLPLGFDRFPRMGGMGRDSLPGLQAKIQTTK